MKKEWTDGQIRYELERIRHLLWVIHGEIDSIEKIINFKEEVSRQSAKKKERE